MIPVHQLTPASSFAVEKLYLYHYLPAQEHPGGWVINATPQGQGTNYQINLGNEPSGVSAFLMLHPPSGSSMDIGFDMGLSEDYKAQVRVRQYLGSGSEYEEALGWTPVQMGGPQQYNIQLNQAAIAAGGKTMMELRFTKLDGGTFAQTAVAQLWSPWKYVTTYTPESRIARVCDGQENYRYGYNTQEKVNEIAGPGNHTTALFWEYDPRLARRWNVDPKFGEMPDESPYSANHDNPIINSDPNGDFGIVGAAIGAAIGGVASLTKSVIQDGWGSLKDGKTWAKAGVNAGAGAIVGATGGLAAGLVATASTSFASSLAEDAIDGKKLDYKKAGVSSLVSTATFGAAKWGADKLGKVVTKHWWNRGNTNALMRHLGRNPQTNVGQLVDRAADVTGLGTSLGIDKLFSQNDPISIELPEVTISAKRHENSNIKVSDEDTKKAHEEIKQNIEKTETK